MTRGFRLGLGAIALVVGLIVSQMPEQAQAASVGGGVQPAAPVNANNQSTDPAYWHDRADEARAKSQQADSPASRMLLKDEADVDDMIAKNPELQQPKAKKK